MNPVRRIGLFGKLPAHGDFVMRDLPSGFVNSWDEWLQHYISGSREQLTDSWLDIYLTSPIWRFVLTSGVLDEGVWAGVMLPSVDRVGRYYPLSAIMPLPDQTNPLEFISMQTSWYGAIEEYCLQALNGEMNIDELSDSINSIRLLDSSGYTGTGQGVNSVSAMQINMEYEEQLPVSVYPYLFDSVLKNTLASYGVWSTTGSERIEPCVFLSQSMPPVNGIPAMLDGRWQHWGWQQPCVVKEFDAVESCHD